jgi:hypothetical protein
MVRCTPRRAQNEYAAADVAACSVPDVGPPGVPDFLSEVQQNPPLLWIVAAERSQ